MLAARVTHYGGPQVIELVDLPTPEPGPGEVLLRVEAVAVTAGDRRLRAGDFPPGFGALAKLAVGVTGPRRAVLGIAFSGVVEQIGRGVTGFGPGNEVAGMNGKTLGMHAQLATAPAGRLARKPAGISHADAAGALFGGTTALCFLRDRAKLRPGQTVLVNGASGAVGSAAVQVARAMGARVTAVTSTQNRDLVRRLGAEEIVDYTVTPVGSEASLARLGGRFDVVVDAVGNIDRRLGLRLTAPNGTLVLVVAGLADTIRARGRVVAGPAPERPADFAELMRLVAEGQLDPLVTVLGGLDAITEAHRVIDTGRKVGNLVVLPSRVDQGSRRVGPLKR